ncbi:MAG: UDP-N-acetylglucosamine 1-carboxyvinyltransferase [bacterium]|nr:UDP-N-acetylglucosamine 1-carboxyvinyltransferase [bacterium]
MRAIIKGGRSLEGSITLAGAKNAATKMMLASLLTDEPCILYNFPDIGDTEITAELCKKIGSTIDLRHGTLTIHTPEIKESRVLQLSRRNRLPILALGPLLIRAGEAEVPILGGDKIGPRPVDLHIEALKALGAEIEVTPESYRASAPKGLHGAEIAFAFPSVGATENALLASVRAKGKTVLRNAAMEPEIIDLIKMLQKMGAIIELGSDRTIYIEGVSHLHGTTHTILPDRNEAVSFACLAIATNGRIFVHGASQDHLITFLNVIRRLGGEYEVAPEGIAFSRKGALKPVHIETGTHPGYMTDWQQPLTVLLTQAEGMSTIHETIYEDRFGYTEDLNRMGARIEPAHGCINGICRFSGKTFNHSAKIYGSTPLSGTNMKIRDIRAGIAHVIAALVADGTSEIDGMEELDRGYEKIDERLRKLGADISRVKSA